MLQKVVLRQALGLGFLGLKCLASCRGCEATKQQLGAGLVVSGKLPMDEPCDLRESDKWVPAPTSSHMDWVACSPTLYLSALHFLMSKVMITRCE